VKNRPQASALADALEALARQPRHHAVELEFEQANVELPAVTMQVIQLSRIFANYWYLAIILGMAADAAVVQHLAMPPSKSSWGLALYSHLWLLGVIGLMFWVSITLCVPVFSMVRPAGAMFGSPI